MLRVIIIDPLSRSGDPNLGDCIVPVFFFGSQKKVSSLLPNTQNTHENRGVIIPQINVARTHKYVQSRHKMRSRDSLCQMKFQSKSLCCDNDTILSKAPIDKKNFMP